MPAKRSAHPGVVLIPPGHGHSTWRARFVNPDTERTEKTRLDPAAIRTFEARRDWAIRKSRALAKRRMDLEAGAPRETGTTIAEAIETFFRDNPSLGARTVGRYRAALAKFREWCAHSGVHTCDDVTAAKLAAFCGALRREPKRAPLKRAKRGARSETGKGRAPDTINGELRAITTCLHHLRRIGVLVKVSSDAIGDSLRKVPGAPKPVTFLSRAEIAALLDAAEKHDVATFELTREGARDVPRYRAVVPLIRGALITGARLGALVGLTWRDVGAHEIRPSGGTSTKRPGIVDLDVVGEGFREWLRVNRGDDTALVFGFTRHEANAALRRLVLEYGAPRKATWQCFRRTCGCYLTCAAGIFGASSAYRAARWIGNSVQVCERHYLGVVREVPADARDVEAALGIAERLTKRDAAA